MIWRQVIRSSFPVQSNFDVQSEDIVGVFQRPAIRPRELSIVKEFEPNVTIENVAHSGGKAQRIDLMMVKSVDRLDAGEAIPGIRLPGLFFGGQRKLRTKAAADSVTAPPIVRVEVLNGAVFVTDIIIEMDVPIV